MRGYPCNQTSEPFPGTGNSFILASMEALTSVGRQPALSSPTCGTWPVSLAFVEAPRTMPQRDAHFWAGFQFCYHFLYETGSATGT